MKKYKYQESDVKIVKDLIMPDYNPKLKKESEHVQIEYLSGPLLGCRVPVARNLLK